GTNVRGAGVDAGGGFGRHLCRRRAPGCGLRDTALPLLVVLPVRLRRGAWSRSPSLRRPCFSTSQTFDSGESPFSLGEKGYGDRGLRRRHHLDPARRFPLPPLRLRGRGGRGNVTPAPRLSRGWG